MKRNLLIIVAILVGAIVLVLIGNVIVIGEKITSITHLYWLEYILYIIIILLFIVWVIRPIAKIYLSPEMPALQIDDTWNADQLHRFGMQLVKNCRYIPKEQRKVHQAELKRNLSMHATNREELLLVIKSEVNARFDGSDYVLMGINGKIKEWAKTVFLVTAISQNSILDSLSVMVLNLKMLEDIILSSGFKPTRPQLFKQCCRILSTALISYVVSDALMGMDSVTPFEDVFHDEVTSGEHIGIEDGGSGHFMTSLFSKIKIPGVVVSSLLQGSTNALMTLRIGYVAKMYVERGAANITGKSKRDVRKKAIKSALITMPSVVSECSSTIGRASANAVLKYFNFKK